MRPFLTLLSSCISFWFWIMHCCIPNPTTENNSSTGMIWVAVNIYRSATNRQGNVMELSGNFTFSREWSPLLYSCRSIVMKFNVWYPDDLTWKLLGPACGWVGRILHPDSCISVSSWSKLPLFIHLVCHCASLSTIFALSQLVTWLSSTAWSVMADLWITLLSLALEARVCVPAVK